MSTKNNTEANIEEKNAAEKDSCSTTKKSSCGCGCKPKEEKKA
jgi:hypothetical protein